MFGGLHRLAICPIAAIALQGCVQATRHSNTMLFATNTSFGLKAGNSAAQIPEMTVGYNRQEAVIMPLVANTQEHSNQSKNRLSPCKIDAPLATPPNGTSPIHPCLLVAVNGKAMDSYSVLASFGAKFSGSGKTGEASGGLAQYFATGMAAQLLALSGGAALVSTGAAAQSSAKANDESASIKALYGDNTHFVAGVAQATAYTEFQKNLLARIQLTNEADIAARMAAFETKAGFATKTNCKTKTDCTANVTSDRFLADYQFNQGSAESAVTTWDAN